VSHARFQVSADGGRLALAVAMLRLARGAAVAIRQCWVLRRYKRPGPVFRIDGRVTASFQLVAELSHDRLRDGSIAIDTCNSLKKKSSRYVEHRHAVKYVPPVPATATLA
jgi:hypothetical protein